MSVCIQYSRPQSGAADTEIFGFDVAVTNFLSAYFRYGAATQFICRPTDIPSFDHFKELAAQAGKADSCVGIDPRHPRHNLTSIPCIFRPDPLIGDLMWTRQQLKGPGFATCGLVHTMSGERIAGAVANLCIAPSDDGDALICPSQAIRKAVLRLWEIHADYLNHRFGGKFACTIQTPVIPLGIDTGKFARLTTPDKRAAQRAALGAPEDETVILFVGRFSFATKAHPLALFLAAERAAKATGKKTRLVMFGYFKPLEMEPMFRDLATDIAHNVAIEFIMNNDPRFPDGLWAGADIFASFSDNVQESFGLTPIEAMACGLPAVVSDWDGYREGVRDGIDGFRIVTVAPPIEAGRDLAEFYYNHNNYGFALTAASQSTAVDIDHATQAFTLLIGNPATRRAMGESGRQRAREVFDWRVVIAAYENLWRELGDRRRARPRPDALPPGWQAAHPSYPNPYAMFEDFPTSHLRDDDILRIAMDEAETDIILRHDINYFVPDVLLPREQMRELIGVIRRAGAAQIGDILAPFPPAQHNLLRRCLGWMLKHGVCARAPRA